MVARYLGRQGGWVGGGGGGRGGWGRIRGYQGEGPLKCRVQS